MLKNKKIARRVVLYAVIGLLAAGVGLWYAFSDSSNSLKDNPLQESMTAPAESVESVSSSPIPTFLPTSTPTPFIFVHICGNVNEPGVYKLPKGSRLVTAIEAAGGFLWSADESYLNLASILSDGARVYVPSVFDTEMLSLNERVAGNGVEEEENNKTAATESSFGVININTASQTELVKLPGIGESRARDIIAYRSKVGEFQKIEDIKNINGIGEAMFNRIKDMICVSRETEN